MSHQETFPDASVEVRGYLESQHTMTLATSAHNIPHATTVVDVNSFQ
jgi:hypothetical protein